MWLPAQQVGRDHIPSCLYIRAYRCMSITSVLASLLDQYQQEGSSVHEHDHTLPFVDEKLE